MIHLDTSVVIQSLTGDRRLAPGLRQHVSAGERLRISTVVVYEFLRGPRTADELLDFDRLFDPSDRLAFAELEAALAARLFSSLRRPRRREIDICIAATAMADGAALWTANPRDFADIPGLRLV